MKLFGTSWFLSIDVTPLSYRVDFTSGFWSARGACAKDVTTKSSCIQDTCLYGACTEIAYIRIADVLYAYIRDANTVKRLRIHLQLSQILELKQYSPVLETEVEASWVGRYSIGLETGIGMS